MASVFEKRVEGDPLKIVLYDNLVESVDYEAFRNMKFRVLTRDREEPAPVNFYQFRDYSVFKAPTVTFARMVKARGDLIFSALAFVVLIPLFMVIGIIITRGSRGPVFYKQERIGLNGRKFKIYKFRTMILNADHHQDLLKEWNEADGPVFKIRDDPRITSFGKFLRKNGLDELPQLYNVVRGEMSLIGPRPPLETEVQHYEPWQLRRLSVKPGITCTWQIHPDRHDVPFVEWMEMDLHYIDHWSLWMDFMLFFKTLKTFFLARGH